MNFRARKRLAYSVFLVLIVCYILWHMLKHEVIQSPSFKLDFKCPACYGLDFCDKLRNFSLSRWSSYAVINRLSRKNVLYARDPVFGDVVLKRLASNRELLDNDERLCKILNSSVDCSIQVIVQKISDLNLLKSALNKTKKPNDLTSCLTERLVGDLLLATKRLGVAEVSQLQNILYTASINTEPLVLQLFSSRDGWPFPVYHGACGRLIAESYEGIPLTTAISTASFADKISFALQVMRIAHNLTVENDSGYSLYVVDPSADNVAVDNDRRLRLIDLENIVVVDRLSMLQQREKGWNVRHTSGSEMEGIAFNTQDLCSHFVSDFNYYAFCAGIVRDLLEHNVPHHIDHVYNVTQLLWQCINPPHNLTRFDIAPRFIKLLQRILNDL